MPATFAADTPHLHPKPLIMVIDDDAPIRLQLRFTLENAGNEVIEAASGQEALDLFKKNPPDLILLDVVMPEMDGIGTCRALRRLAGGAHTPLVMITSMEDTETITQAFKAGATDFINKPINMLILGYRVDYWLRSGGIVRELKINQQRLYNAQELARLAHWERNLETGEFRLTCHQPEMFGLSLPCDYQTFFTPIVTADRELARTQIEAACAENRPFSLHYRIVLPDGSERIILNQGKVVCEDTAPFRLAVGILQDVTERKLIEETIRQSQEQLQTAHDGLEQQVEQRTRELQETQKQVLHTEKLAAIGKLSASIAHEFNNPLQGIMTILKGVEKRATMEVEDRALLHAALDEGNRIKDLIRCLQDFNRPSSGRKSIMDVHHALESILLLQTSDFDGKGIVVQRDYREGLPKILAVLDQIKQVFLNLLTNAADACPCGGVITVSTWQEEQRVAVAIKDTGKGIKPEDMDHIFRPFFTTKSEVKGTGLGLSVSYGIINGHQGEIRVASTPGAGAIFTVILPIQEPEKI